MYTVHCTVYSVHNIFVNAEQIFILKIKLLDDVVARTAFFSLFKFEMKIFLIFYPINFWSQTRIISAIQFWSLGEAKKKIKCTRPTSSLYTTTIIFIYWTNLLAFVSIHFLPKIFRIKLHNSMLCSLVPLTHCVTVAVLFNVQTRTRTYMLIVTGMEKKNGK